MKFENDMISVKYSAATVLLDLTANEYCIEKVGQLIKEKDLFTLIKNELVIAFARKITAKTLNKMYLQRFRDLLIGIVLNVCCNVESEDVSKYMLGLGALPILSKILVDSRHDWPTNGAALAIL